MRSSLFRFVLLFCSLALLALYDSQVDSISTLAMSDPTTQRHLRKGLEVSDNTVTSEAEHHRHHHHNGKAPHIAVLSLGLKIFKVSFLAFFVFLGLALICDDYLCPAIDIICENLQITSDIAGATLLAFGSSAPEIFMNVAATASGQVTMSLPAILGSAIIAFGMIPCICSITVGTDMKLQTWAVTRDSSVYVVAVYLMWIFLEDGYIDLYESSVLTAFYAVYLVIIFIPVCFCSPKGTVDYSTIEEASVEQEEEEEEEDETSFIISVLSKPFSLAFSLTVPTQPEDSPSPSTSKAFATVMLSLIWITILSNFALTVANMAAAVTGMSPTTAGATVLAFGAQIPDTFGSLALAKAGQPGGAVANAIGSQVINVSLGVGAPFLLYNLIYKKPIFAGDDDGMRQLVACLSVVISTFWLVMYPINRWIQGTSHISEARLSRLGGLCLGFVSIVMYSTFIFLQETNA